MNDVETAEVEAKQEVLDDINGRIETNLNVGNGLMVKEDLEICEEFDADIPCTEEFREKYEDVLDLAIASISNNHVNVKLSKSAINKIDKATYMVNDLVNADIE